MNKSVLMIMGGALVIAVLVAVVVQRKLAPAPQVVSAPTTQILVAGKKLLVGEKAGPEDVYWQDWPDSALFTGVIKRAEQADEENLDVYKMPLRRNVEAGEPVTTQALINVEGESNNFLAAQISPGMRAVAIAVKADTMAGGFISPGDHVDVILSYTPSLPDGTDEFADQLVQRYASETVLSNVKILAVDQNAKAAEQGAKIAKTVTVEVTQAGAQVLALAGRMGDISLALRRVGEKDDGKSAIAPLVTDTTTSALMRRLNEIRQQTGGRSNTIRMYSGTTVQNVPVRVQDDLSPNQENRDGQ